MKVLVTGHAGFIGFHTAMALLKRGTSVVGLDVVNDYYDVGVKRARLDLLVAAAAQSDTEYVSVEGDLADRACVDGLFDRQGPTHVINLAAQAGVRYSLENPQAYIDSNVVGFTNILEACRAHKVEHLTYASTSSVYGANTKMPFSETHGVDHPLQLYAATKRSNELMAHSYSHLFQLPTTGLRFFTVYGPWGRPDMALFLFTKNIIAGEPIKVFNNGQHSRDFTFVADIVEGVIRVNDRPSEPNPEWRHDNPSPESSSAPYRIYNIGNNQPINLLEYINAIEDVVGKKAEMEMLPMQPGDVPDTFADVSALQKSFGYKPQTEMKEGVRLFVDWYRGYYKV